MKSYSICRQLCIVLPACAALLACGGGSSGSADGGSTTAATSLSFSPTTARSSTGQNVALRWAYAVNNGQPIAAKLLDVEVSVTVSDLTVDLDPVSLQRRAVMRGPVAATAGNTSFSGSYEATTNEDLAQLAGKTTIKTSSTDIKVTLSGGGDTATAVLQATVGAFTPSYEWFLDRDTLDQLPINHVETLASSGMANIRINVDDEAVVANSNQVTAMSDRWTVLEKLPSMVVRGKTYTNVVRVSRQTRVPDFAGSFSTVTMQYWVAKGVGMIRGQGVYRVLNADNVVIELLETNLAPV